jgi:hypothetical protein
VKDQVFNFRIDDGPVQSITVKTGIYRDAAAAIPAVIGLSLPIIVEIWAPELVPEYGPYHFSIMEDLYGGINVKFLC